MKEQDIAMFDMVLLDHTQMKKELVDAYLEREPIMIWGGPGIGKSQITEVAMRAIAINMDREFIPWVGAGAEIHKKLLTDAEFRKNSFIYADYRLTQRDSVELTGILDLTGGDYVKWQPQLLMKVLSMPGAAGVLFLDEMAKAADSVLRAAYQIINEKACGEESFSPWVNVFAASNRPGDGCGDRPMDSALNNRFSHFELDRPSVKDWVKWAEGATIEEQAKEFAKTLSRQSIERQGTQKTIDSRITLFLQQYPDMFYSRPDELKKNKPAAWASPRSWEKVNKRIQRVEAGSENELEALYIKAGGAVGSSRAMRFKAFIQRSRTLHLEALLNDSSLLLKLSIDDKFAFIEAMAHYYQQNKKDRLQILKYCLEAADKEHLSMEILIAVLSTIKAQDATKFKEVVWSDSWIMNKLLNIQTFFKALS